METAKVDIRKLQLLNDRINQCIDALNQVRLSVHGLSQGLSHTGGPLGSQFGQGGQMGSPYGLGSQGLGGNPFTQGINPFTQGGASPFGFGSQGIGQMPLGQSPWNQGFVPGLSHTGGQTPFGGQSPFTQGINPYLSSVSPEALEASVRPIWADPFLTARITQTFPYAQYPVPPVVTIY